MRTPEDAPTDPDRLIRLGTVASVDLAGATCTVNLDSGVVAGPLKWIERRAGATRTWSPPSVGEQVMLICPGGEIGAGLVLRGIFSTAHPAPGNTLAELTEYADGAIISYDPVAHALTVTLPDGGTAAITAPGGVTITGPLHVTGPITSDADVTGAGTSLHTHHHTGVATGSGVTGAPA